MASTGVNVRFSVLALEAATLNRCRALYFFSGAFSEL